MQEVQPVIDRDERGSSQKQAPRSKPAPRRSLSAPIDARPHAPVFVRQPAMDDFDDELLALAGGGTGGAGSDSKPRGKAAKRKVKRAKVDMKCAFGASLLAADVGI